MKPLKAPGPDGFQPYFFQTQWSVVGGDLCRFIKEVFANKPEVAEVNHSYLVLIPKVPKPEYIHQFRPIGLCNVIYKTLTKILVNRLKPLMQKRNNSHICFADDMLLFAEASEGNWIKFLNVLLCFVLPLVNG